MSPRLTFWLGISGALANILTFAVFGDWWLWIGAVLGLLAALLSADEMDRAS